MIWLNDLSGIIQGKNLHESPIYNKFIVSSPSPPSFSALGLLHKPLFFPYKKRENYLLVFILCQAQCLALSTCIYLFSPHNNPEGEILFLMLLIRKLRLEHPASS